MPENFKFKVADETHINIQGEINMEGSDDLTINIPKNSGKYFIDIHPIE